MRRAQCTVSSWFETSSCRSMTPRSSPTATKRQVGAEWSGTDAQWDVGGVGVCMCGSSGLVGIGCCIYMSAVVFVRSRQADLLCLLLAAGAQVMSLVNSDENKTFGVVLRTPVENSKVGGLHASSRSFCTQSMMKWIFSSLIRYRSADVFTICSCFASAGHSSHSGALCAVRFKEIPHQGAFCSYSDRNAFSQELRLCNSARPCTVGLRVSKGITMLQEPFVELMKGSLNTFLNAFTYPDRTCYPVASCNQQVGILAPQCTLVMSPWVMHVMMCPMMPSTLALVFDPHCIVSAMQK